MISKRHGVLFLGDVHFEKEALTEIEAIFKELWEIPASLFIQLGDLCDRNRLDPIELDSLTYTMQKSIENFDSVYVLKGNHDSLDGTRAIIDYLRYIGVSILNDDYFLQFTNKYWLGHWFTDKSWDSFGKDYRYTVEEMKQKDFNYCFLGHQHDFQTIDEEKNIYHLGSARYVKFSEKESLKKRVAFVCDNKLEFIELKSVIPIYNVSNVRELEKLPKKSKVRFIYKTFTSFKEDVKIVNQLKNNFHSFKSKIDFKVSTHYTTDDIKKETSNRPKDLIYKWLNTINDNEMKNLLEEEIKKEKL